MLAMEAVNETDLTTDKMLRHETRRDETKRTRKRGRYYTQLECAISTGHSGPSDVDDVPDMQRKWQEAGRTTVVETGAKKSKPKSSLASRIKAKGTHTLLTDYKESG